MAHLRINSRENIKFKRFFSLKSKKGRDKENAFIIEGLKFVMEALQYCSVENIIVSETYFCKDKYAFDGLPENKTVILPDSLFEKLAETETAQGIMAVCAKKNAAVDLIFQNNSKDRLFLLAEGINDPGNLGTMIRAADAAGADAVILSKDCAELYNPKALRGSAGSAFHLPVIEGADLSEFVAELKCRGVSVYAAHLRGAVYPYGLDLTKDTAFIIGNEAKGLSDEITAMVDMSVKIPILGKAESLNAAVAAGILLYEAARQRVAMQGGGTD